MSKGKKKKADADRSWKKFEDFASNLMQVKPEDLKGADLNSAKSNKKIDNGS